MSAIYTIVDVKKLSEHIYLKHEAIKAAKMNLLFMFITYPNTEYTSSLTNTTAIVFIYIDRVHSESSHIRRSIAYPYNWDSHIHLYSVDSHMHRAYICMYMQI